MIEVGSLVGFAAAFVIVAWGVSALLCGGALAARRIVATGGPRAERAMFAAALVLAPVVAAIVVGVVGARSLLLAGIDHCTGHGHHPHLCLVHGGAWVEVPVAVVAVAMVGAYLVVRVCQLAWTAWTARGALREIAAVSREVEPGVFVASVTTAFCFTAGIIRPRIYVSSAIWDTLEADERAAMLAHERAHVRQRDLAWRMLFGIATLFGAPILARVVLGRWERATERACDRDATRVVQSDVVASALVRMSRLQLAATAGMSFGGAAALDERVQALLADPAHDERLARALRGGAIAMFVIAIGSAALGSDPIHHALETLLGLI
ncbi:MAG TPA: M56 family metallopeptidase [Kofleriaceae bacterium]|nr:M56 family metallopeptidase [Kofleriaceae bacterium]